MLKDRYLLDKIKERFEEIENNDNISRYNKGIKYGELMSQIEFDYGVVTLSGKVYKGDITPDNEDFIREIEKLYSELSKARYFEE